MSCATINRYLLFPFSKLSSIERTRNLELSEIRLKIEFHYHRYEFLLSRNKNRIEKRNASVSLRQNKRMQILSDHDRDKVEVKRERRLSSFSLSFVSTPFLVQRVSFSFVYLLRNRGAARRKLSFHGSAFLLRALLRSVCLPIRTVSRANFRGPLSNNSSYLACYRGKITVVRTLLFPRILS